MADIQVNLLPKGERSLQSHDIAKTIRVELAPIATRNNANIKVAEVPPGPPVLETLVAEVYGPDEEGPPRAGAQNQAHLRIHRTAWWTWTGTWRPTRPNSG